ncbi:MAG: cytochrome c-type biogenesis CcmF C-terminal domain-containing protein, partial [Cyclobacteriaceae bacterium]
YHTMITYKNSNTALKTSMVLVIATFILVLYATFLTRSGILGDASVHSFTDLGLSGQLLIYLGTFFTMSIGMLVWRWKNIPTSEKEVSSYSREFWIFIGVTTLCLMAFQVIITTSFPVYNTILEGLGIESNIAMPADQVVFYSNVQLWFALALALLSGTGQFFWWKHMDPQKLRNELTTPILITLVLSVLVMILGEVKDLSYILLLTASIYSVVANLKILLSLFKTNFNLAGGSVAHIGIGMILIGILFSSGYSEVISVNNTGLRIANDEEFNSSNLLLFIDQAQSMGDYDLTYKGRYIKAKGVPGYVNLNDIAATDDVYKAILNKDIARNGKTYSRKSDTLEINPENIYCEVGYQSESGKAFTLWPRIQVNPSMGQVHSPDIKRAVGSDLYSYVSWAPYLDPEEEVEWKHTDSITVKIGEQFFVNDFVARLTNIERTQDILGVRLNEGDLAVKASIELQGKSRNYLAEPFFLIKNNMAGRIPDVINDLGVKITLSNIHPQEDSFDLDIYTTQKDFIVLKAISKPMINVLWIGTLLLVAGFVIAIRRRYTDFLKMRDKGVE